MNKFTSLIMAFVALVSFSSCDLDKDDNGSSQYFISYGEVVKSGASHNIITDKGATLVITSNACPDFELEENQRVIVNFTILGSDLNADEETYTYKVRLNAIDEILCKKTILESELDTQDKIDSIGSDPLDISAIWFSADKYMNVEFSFKHSTETHLISGVVTEQDGDNVTIDVRHNAYDDQAHTVSKSVVSFLVDDLFPAESQKLNVKITWTDYEGEAQSQDEVFELEVEEDSDDDDDDTEASSFSSRTKVRSAPSMN